MHYACPKCKKNIGIDGSGKYECPYCKEFFSVSAEDFHKALKTSMSSPVKKRTFSIAYLWILSITGIFLSLFSFGPSFFAGLLILLSSLFIFPPIRKLYSKKFPFRLRYILIVSAALLFTAVWITPKEYNTTGTMAKTTQKVLPKEIDSSTDNPVFKIAYNCVKVKKITVNQKELIESEIEKFCNQQYTVKLKSGENLYSIVIVSRNSKIEESIKVVFDEEAYKIRLAEEQAKAKAEAAAREKAAAEAKAKAAEAKAKAEAELLKSRGTKYCSARKSYDNKYAPIISKNDKWKFDTTREKKGRYLTQTDCERIIKSLIKYSDSYLGGISDTELKSIISGKLWIGMDSFQFAISIGLPNDINTTTTAWNTNQQWVYYKDSYGISSYYAYFDDGKLTSTQDF